MSDQVNDAELQSEQTIMNADETFINRGDQSCRPQFTGMNRISQFYCLDYQISKEFFLFFVWIYDRSNFYDDIRKIQMQRK